MCVCSMYVYVHMHVRLHVYIYIYLFIYYMYMYLLVITEDESLAEDTEIRYNTPRLIFNCSSRVMAKVMFT
jgi:hypothetical protein